jgi:hypothetical protein
MPLNHQTAIFPANLLCLEDRAWVHHRPNTEIPKPLYSDQEVISYAVPAIPAKPP